MARSGAATIERIIEVAERSFGLHGINGVSLRQIGREAGAANNFAVQFHFKDRDGLVRAILERRLPEFEMRRRTMLEKVSRNGSAPTLHQLLEILYTPLFEQKDEHGRHSYAAFLSGLTRFEQMSARREFNPRVPVTLRIREMFAEQLSHLSPRQLDSRWTAVHAMMTTTISLWDARANRAAFQDLIRMGVAAFNAETRSAERAD
jgi:AcrR family transcriptional regulator